MIMRKFKNPSVAKMKAGADRLARKIKANVQKTKNRIK